MIVIRERGSFQKTERYLKGLRRRQLRPILERYAKEGMAVLAAATPVDSGVTAASWGYEISVTKSGFSVAWTNGNVVKGVPIAIILQYGHATGTGGFVQGQDYINPAIRPVIDKMTEALWREVKAD